MAAKRKKDRSRNEEEQLSAADQFSNKLLNYVGVADFGRSLYPDQVDTNEAIEGFERELNEPGEDK